MEWLGVISKINTPTALCAGMVVVSKKSGEVRTCVDLKPLNERFLREPHPMLRVDDIIISTAVGSHIFQQAQRE